MRDVTTGSSDVLEFAFFASEVANPVEASKLAAENEQLWRVRFDLEN